MILPVVDRLFYQQVLIFPPLTLFTDKALTHLTDYMNLQSIRYTISNHLLHTQFNYHFMLHRALAIWKHLSGDFRTKLMQLENQIQLVRTCFSWRTMPHWLWTSVIFFYNKHKWIVCADHFKCATADHYLVNKLILLCILAQFKSLEHSGNRTPN